MYQSATSRDALRHALASDSTVRSLKYAPSSRKALATLNMARAFDLIHTATLCRLALSQFGNGIMPSTESIACADWDARRRCGRDETIDRSDRQVCDLASF